MNHFLAYGNSDQASFRHEQVRNALDYMMVPGTIAAYYPDATAAFVLSSELNYVIDPRTPLFQGVIRQPRASHFSLAEHMGEAVKSHVEDESEQRGEVTFAADLYTEDVIADLVRYITAFQSEYGGRAPDIEEKLNRYRRLLAAALPSQQVASANSATRSPSFILAPYFVAKTLTDEWWNVNQTIWTKCEQQADSLSISPVVALEDVQLLDEALGQLSTKLAEASFFWVGNFDERRASSEDLGTLLEAVRAHSASRRLVNLYGGFFSICLHHVGLWGFNNGLGYSESRNWPELSATGAAPARYYVRELHMYLPPGQAQQIVDVDPFFSCPCDVCASAGVSGIVGLSYHDLKRHFVLARAWERELVESNSPEGVATHLLDAEERFNRGVRPQLPERLRPLVGFLGRWAESLRDIHSS